MNHELLPNSSESLSTVQGPIFTDRLSVFERMMVVDDRDDYPMLAEVELHFSGVVDVQILQETLLNAVARHPLLRVLLQRKWPGEMRWVMPEPNQALVDFRVVDESGEAPKTDLSQFRSRIDLEQHPGLRVLLRVTADQVILHFAVHHACCDGGGIFRLIEDVLLLYSSRCDASQSEIELPELDHALLHRRGRFPVRSASWKKLIGEFGFGFFLARRFGREKPIKLSLPANEVVARDDSIVAAPGNDFSDLLRPLRRKAAELSVTVNDLLLRDLFLALQRWNRSHRDTGSAVGESGRNACYRVMMPCNLREEHQENLSAANVMSFSFLSRTDEELADSEELLGNIRFETEYIREENASLYFIRSLKVASWIPGGTRIVAEARKCMATALLSNIADPLRTLAKQLPRVGGKLRVGGMTLEKIDARPPLRPQTRIGFVVNSYANQLIIGTAFDRNQMTAGDAEDFLQVYRKTLEQAIG